MQAQQRSLRDRVFQAESSQTKLRLDLLSKQQNRTTQRHCSRPKTVSGARVPLIRSTRMRRPEFDRDQDTGVDFPFALASTIGVLESLSRTLVSLPTQGLSVRFADWAHGKDSSSPE